MIRFLNLKDQIIEGDCSFAFYHTISNEIFSFEGDQVFESLEEFKTSYNNILSDYRPYSIERFIDLIPEDFF